MIDDTTVEVSAAEESVSTNNLEIIHDPDAPVQDVVTPHPDVIMAIVITALNAADGNADQELLSLYFTAREYVLQQRDTSKHIDLTDVIFTHYIEAYRALMIFKHKQSGTKESINIVTLHNDAALSVFDLYFQRTSDRTIRKMLVFAGRGIHRAITAYQQIHGDDRPMKELISHLSTLFLLLETIKFYVKGARLTANLPYIRWLHGFLKDTLANPDLTHMNDNKQLSDIFKQVSSTDIKIITVPDAS